MMTMYWVTHMRMFVSIAELCRTVLSQGGDVKETNRVQYQNVLFLLCNYFPKYGSQFEGVISLLCFNIVPHRHVCPSSIGSDLLLKLQPYFGCSAGVQCGRSHSNLVEVRHWCNFANLQKQYRFLWLHQLTCIPKQLSQLWWGMCIYLYISGTEWEFTPRSATHTLPRLSWAIKELESRARICCQQTEYTQE